MALAMTSRGAIAVLGHRPLEEVLGGDDPVLAVQVEHLEDLSLQVPHRVVKIVEDRLRRLEHRLLDDPLFEELAGDLLHEPDAERVVRPDALDLLELLRRRLEDAAQGLEAPDALLGRRLAVAPGSAEAQQQLDDLVVGEALQPGG